MATPLFPWLTVQADAVIRKASLEAHEMGQTLSDADLATDATDDIETAAGDVVMAINEVVNPLSWPFSTSQWAAAFPDITQSAREQRRALQEAQANKVVTALAIAALRKRNGSEQSLAVSQAMADGRGEAVIGSARIGSAEQMLARLVKDVTSVATNIRTSAQKTRRLGAILMGKGD